MAVVPRLSGNHLHAVSDKLEGESPLLDAIVAYANQFTLSRSGHKPYWIISDAATLSVLAYAWAFFQHFPAVSGVSLGAASLVALLIHKLALETKAAFGKGAARSSLPGRLLIVIPTFLLVSFLFEQPLSLTLPLLRTLLPWYDELAQVWRFLRGRRYGKPFSNGALHLKSIFASYNYGCRG
jgi:hypothetical protein